MLGQQLLLPGPLGQLEHRHEPGGRHQVRIIKDRHDAVARFHLRGALREWWDDDVAIDVLPAHEGILVLRHAPDASRSVDQGSGRRGGRVTDTPTAQMCARCDQLLPPRTHNGHRYCSHRCRSIALRAPVLAHDAAERMDVQAARLRGIADRAHDRAEVLEREARHIRRRLAQAVEVAA